MAASVLTRGSHTFQVPFRMFAHNRQRLCDQLNKLQLPPGSAVLLQGGVDQTRYSTDANPNAFRQESFFFWTFGVLEPDCYGVVDVRSGESTVFVPKLSADYEIWCGKIPTCDELKTKYEVTRVGFVSEMADHLRQHGYTNLLLLKGLNTDSQQTYQPPQFPGIETFSMDTDTLFPVISECRVFKSDDEISVLRYVCKVSSEAHKAMMKAAKPSLFEYQLESTFLHHIYYNAGCRHAAYLSISGSGCNCAILHYGHAAAPNDRQIKNGDLCLLDMGGEYMCYCADITTTFPVNGKFSEQQKVIYRGVLDANRAVMAAAKPGVSWVEMHKLAERTLLTHLLKGGLVRGDIDRMMKARVGAVFMPHGLGHLLGLDVHDVGGYPPGTQRLTEPGLRSLRTTRTLQPRMCITIEPGCYFIDSLLDKAFADPELSQFLVRDEIEKYRGFGGVRIEDDVLITETGCENLVDVPRTVEEIEKFMESQ